MLKKCFGKKIIETDRPAFVMGILNATPDSFYKNSRGGIDRALKLIDEGADILDIGGESTRPGFTPVSVEEEINRVVPLIREIKKHSDIIISVDTSKPQVMKACMEEGIDIINNVLAFENDSQILSEIAEKDLSVILMHHDGGSVKDVKNYLFQVANKCEKYGIKKDKIIIDPGIGFGKTQEENISIIKNINELCTKDFLVLMALSRKSVFGTMTGKPVEERLSGTISADLISVIKGVEMIRVHDVAEAVDSLNVMKYLI